MRKKLLLWLALIVFLILPFFNGLIQLGVDYLWFNEIQMRSIFTTRLSTMVLCGIATFLITGFLLITNILIAERLSSGRVFVPTFGAGFDFFTLISKFDKRIFLLISIAISIFSGITASGFWEPLLRFIHSTPFGNSDPLFKRDIGYYLFQLPLLRTVYYHFIFIFLITFIFTALIYIIRGGIYIGAFPPTIPKKIKAHLSVLAGLIVASLYFHFDFTLATLVTNSSQILSGAGYTDIHFQVPILQVLKIAAIVSGIVIIGSIGSRTLLPAGIAIAGLIVITFVGSSGKQIIQKLIVAPNELSAETPYIKWSIAGTRAAYNLDKIEEKEFSPSENLSKSLIDSNSTTLKNIRLWDHSPLLTTFSQLQEIRTYYEFLDVDNDRYEINGELRQVMLSPRELVPSSLPSRIWINEKLTYTHGYGACLGPVNQVTREGLPEFFIKNIPPISTSPIEVKRPEIYFGEADAGYVIVNTSAKEFDYPSGDQNVYSQYEGTGGISAGKFLKRLLFVAHLKELKLLLSTDIKPQSRILLYRKVIDRVSHVAPFFKYDRDPYIVITKEGKLVWIIDGYTTTDAYPYSYKNGSINYIRNSVKVLVDAYNGDVKFFMSDPADPIVQTYSKIFPGTVQAIENMPEDIRSHLRYPQTMFALQARVFSTYHMTDPQVFYNKEDLWKVPSVDPSVENDNVMAPYYTIMKLAEVGIKEEFILMVPFAPAKKDNMIAWLAARCDGPDYGKLLVFNFPKQKLVFGPRQIESRINQEPEISRQLALWNQGGSRVIRGSLLVIPVSQSLLFVQPLYIESSQGGGLPELKRVIVAYGNTIVMEENLELSLEKIFGVMHKSQSVESTDMVVQQTPENTGSTLKDLVIRAQNEYSAGQQALTKGDLGAYGDAMKRVKDLINEIAKQVE
jgi:uncharacterized membrane protein (UPF0182 family)